MFLSKSCRHNEGLTSSSQKTSNLNSIKVVLIAFFLSLSACNLPKPEPRSQNQNEDGDGNATFFVESSEGEVISEKVHDGISLTKSKNYRLSLCLKDLAYSKVITFQNFKVIDINKEVKSDAKGCVVWTEDIEFNALAKPNYLYFERTIQAVGMHHGQRKLKLAINPWADGKDLKYAIDISKKVDAPEFIADKEKAKLALFAETNEPRKLWINDGRLSIIQKNFITGAANLKVEFTAVPFLELTNINKVNYNKILSVADVDVDVFLIQVRYETKNGVSKEVRYKLSDNNAKKGKAFIQNGELKIQSDLTIPENATEGQLIIGLKVNILNQPKNISQISEFNGIYTIGGYNQLIGRTFVNRSLENLQDENGKPFTIESYLQQGSQPTTNDGRQKAKVYVESVMLEYRGHGVEINGERELRFSVKACVTNGLDLRNMQAQTFQIEHFQVDANSPSVNVVRSHHGHTKIAEPKKTSTDSCITWDDSVMYTHLSCPRFVRGKIHFKNENLAVDEELDVAFNPWEPKVKEFSRDIRPPYGSPAQMNFTCGSERAHPSHFFLENYSWSNAQNPEYTTDNNLSLIIHRAFNIDIEPKLKVFSQENGNFDRGELRPGHYLMKIAIMRPKSEIERGKPPLAAWQNKIVFYNGEKVQSFVDFDFYDLFDLGNMNHILFEFYPIRQNSIAFDASKNAVLPSPITDYNSIIDTNAEYVSPTYGGNITIDKKSENFPVREFFDRMDARIADRSAKGKGLKNNFYIDQYIAKSKQIQAKAMDEYRKKNQGEHMKANGVVLMSLVYPESVENINRGYIAGRENRLHLPYSGYNSETYLKSWQDSKSKDLTYLRDFVESDTVTVEHARILCAYFVERFYESYFQKSPFEPSEKSSMVRDCLEIAKENPNDAFAIENKYFVQNVKSAKTLASYPGEKLQFNTQYSVSMAQSLTESEQNQINLSANLNGGLSWRGPLASLTATLGAGYSHQVSWSVQDTENHSNTSSLNNQKSINVEIIPMTLTIDRYTSCKSIHLNPLLFDKATYSKFNFFKYLQEKSQHPTLRSYLKQTMPADEIVSLIQKSIMICSDKVKTQPITVQENYFKMDHERGTNESIAPNDDPKARNFYFALRGRADYYRLKVILQQNILLPKTFKSKDESLNDQFLVLHKAFEKGVPVFTGFINRTSK